MPGRRDVDSAYRRRLDLLLLPAAFFNGYDGQLRALLLPQLQRAFHVGVAAIGALSVPIAAGQFVAFLVVRRADRVGRRPVLLVSLGAYAALTAATAAATSVWSFALLQGLAQVALGSEYALAVLVVAEETPPARRGRALGRLLLAGPLGAIFTAVLLGAGLLHAGLGWRAFYLVGAAPALLLAGARAGLRETGAFRAAAAGATTRPRLADCLARPFGRRVATLGAVNLLVKVPVTAGAGWWVYYAEHVHHLSTGLVALDLGTAYALGTLGFATCGRLVDRFGRRPVAVAFILAGCGLGAALFQVSSEAASVPLLLAAVFFGLGVDPALSALSAESFPTRLRAQASAVVGNGFANAGALAGPALVGLLGAKGGAIGSIGGAVSVLMALGLGAAAVLALAVHETRGADLRAPDPLAGLPEAAQASTGTGTGPAAV
ncbi:MAG: MFS transporter [Actinomycetota bacterium]|nr:MFS transporter [Actinomycetota bacterium]